MNEVERIKDAYSRRDICGKPSLYSLMNRGALYTYQQRERAILDFLKEIGWNLSEKKILEVGCGKGDILRDFVKYGARSENCSGIDLLTDRIEQARHLSPNIDFQCGNAEMLPYQDGDFDLVIVFTVFSSILDTSMRKNVALEVMRVLKQGGFLIWYDYHINNPSNPDVRGVNKSEIVKLFPNCRVQLKRITLAPPISRWLADYSWIACCLLEKLPILRTHYLGIITCNRQDLI